jgi:hypothetical protein
LNKIYGIEENFVIFGGRNFNIMKKQIICTLILLLLFASCYKDGPYISFSGKRARLNGDWSFKEVNMDGIDSTEVYQQRFDKITFVSDHDIWAMYTADVLMRFFTNSSSFIEALGAFKKNYTHLSVYGSIIRPVSGGSDQDWKILKLGNGQF